MNKQDTRTLIIARYGMLECGTNYKGTMSDTCSHCCCKDNEEHRLNNCPKYDYSNYSNTSDQIKFDTVFSNDINDLKTIITRISNVWNVETGHGSINTS